MSFIKKYWSIIVLLIIVGVVIWTNFPTYGQVTGWDNLQPEYNITTNLGRSLTTVWQEYQGLGLLGGMGHGADLVRQLVIAPLLVFLPFSIIRYVLISAMWFLGSIGIYFLLKYLFKSKNEFFENIAALVGSAFYILNIGTVQNFYVPFEPYYWYFGFLPWLIYTLIKFLDNKSRKNLSVFAIVTLLATPMGYLQTAYITYLILLVIIVLSTIIKSKDIRINSISENLRTLFISLLINAFWLIPVSYFTFTNVDVTINSKMNQLATSEVHQQNNAYGGLLDVVRLNGYWLGLHDIADSNEFVYLMQDWREHTELTSLVVLSITFFAFTMVGSLCLIVNKRKFSLGLVLSFVFGLVMLGGENLPFGPIVIVLNKFIPLFEQIFRSPFTKWIVPVSMLYSIMFGFGVLAILNLFNKKNVLKITAVPLFVFTLVASLLFYSLPVFQGDYIYDRIEHQVPSEYQSLFEFFNSQPKQARIARFPIQTFWGWDFTDWGYRGSGFLWYGIEQPILDRAFDVWNAENETYYHEISTAFYGNDVEAFRNVLDKYDVTYALIDKNVIPSGQGEGVLRFEETEKMLKEIGARVVFSEGDILVYELGHINNPGFVYAPNEFVEANNNSTYARRDLVYGSNNYITGKGTTNYPFSNLLQEKVEADYEGENVIFNRDLNNFTGNLVIPGLTPGRYYSFNTELGYDGTFVSLDFQPQLKIKTNDSLTEINKLPNSFFEVPDVNEVLVYVADQKLELTKGEEKSEIVELVAGESFPFRVFENSGVNTDLKEQFDSSQVAECWTRPGKVGDLKSERRSGGVLAIAAKDAVGCVALRIGQISAGSLLSVNLPYRSSVGASKPHFCIQKEGEAECINEDVFYSTPPSITWSSVNREVIIDESAVYWVIVGGRPSETDEVWETEYKAPEATVFESIVNLSYSEDNWDKLMQDTKINLTKTNNLEVEIPAKLVTVDLATQGKSEIENCDIFDRGSVDRLIRDGVVYRAEDNAAACDLVFLQNITTNKEYLLRITGENIKGRGAKFYLYNQSSMRNDLEALLGEGDFDETYSVLSWPELDIGNYTFNLGVRSFGRSAESKIDSVGFYQTPIEWFADWQLTPTRSNFIVDDETKIYTNDIIIGEVQKTGTYKYSVEVDGDGLVVLSQSYDPGWIAYLGSIFGEKLEHVKVNGWANGWLVGNDQSPITNDQITIVYWPQYLQFAGFGILLLTFGYLIIPKKTH